MEFPEDLEFWTLDEVAECMPVSDATSAALWMLMPPDDPQYSPESREFPEPDGADPRSYLQARWTELATDVQADIVRASAEEPPY